MRAKRRKPGPRLLGGIGPPGSPPKKAHWMMAPRAWSTVHMLQGTRIRLSHGFMAGRGPGLQDDRATRTGRIHRPKRSIGPLISAAVRFRSMLVPRSPKRRAGCLPATLLAPAWPFSDFRVGHVIRRMSCAIAPMSGIRWITWLYAQVARDANPPSRSTGKLGRAFSFLVLGAGRALSGPPALRFRSHSNPAERPRDAHSPTTARRAPASMRSELTRAARSTCHSRSLFAAPSWCLSKAQRDHGRGRGLDKCPPGSSKPLSPRNSLFHRRGTLSLPAISVSRSPRGDDANARDLGSPAGGASRRSRNGPLPWRSALNPMVPYLRGMPPERNAGPGA